LVAYFIIYWIIAGESFSMDEDYLIAEVLGQTKTIAMVGASANWKRPSFFVMKYLQKNGFRVIPVNPGLAGQTFNGEICYESLSAIPDSVDLVDVFRRSEECPALAEEALAIGAKSLWLQIGVTSDQAQKIASDNGMQFIQDKCPKIEHSRLSGLLGLGGFYSRTLSSHRASNRQPPSPRRNGGLTQSHHLETLSIHAGNRPDAATGSRIPPIYQTTAFAFDDCDHASSLYNLQEPGNIYGRLSNPTTAVLEQRLAALDGAVGACCVASGHAAQLVALYPLMAPGKTIVASDKLYGGSITQFTRTFNQFGWRANLVNIHDLDAVNKAVSKKDVAVLFAESLANPDGNVSDIDKLAKIAHDAGVPLIIDNTMATPVMCQPGKFGTDIIVYSTTKFLSGHGNALGGAVVDMGTFDWLNCAKYPSLSAPDPAYHGITFAETFGKHGFITYCHASVLRDLGPTLSPMNAFLTLTGLETLPLRMRQHNENAAKVANFLNQHEKILNVSWAGLSSSPYYSLAKKYLQNGAGSVFTVSLKGGYEAGIKLVENCNLISHLANIGDTRTLIVHPASTTHRQLTSEQREAAGVGDNIVRLSIGIEHADDIIADLDGALQNID
jgi:O-acetylhomoserine (thiol)-lyase